VKLKFKLINKKMPKISIRFGGYQNPDSIHNQSAMFFGEKLKEYFKDLIIN